MINLGINFLRLFTQMKTSYSHISMTFIVYLENTLARLPPFSKEMILR